MSFSLKEIALVALLLILSGSLVRYCTPEKVRYETAEQSQKIDSLTTLTRALHIDKSQLQDSLAGTTTAFQEYVEKHKDKLATYNRMIGQLNLKVDSLQQASTVSLEDLAISGTPGTYQDTTMEKTSTFGNGLIQARCYGGIQQNALFLRSPELRQLRPVRIDQAQFVEGNEFRTVTTSRDFTDLKVVSVTTKEEEGRRFPWTEIVAVGSFILGYAL